MELDPGLPKKVLQKAHQLGVHNDCIAADVDKACEDCKVVVQTAMDFYYGHITDTDVLIFSIWMDLEEDRA